ncbi:MAG TPA: 1-phosphofructokinase [Clostridia bacterium]|nr:1-phosphofructokinase [Clostridia bacterium]
MIITVTLNPAVDKTINIDSFKINSVNRVWKSRKDAGGKGINVSKVLMELGENSVATGFLGGETGLAIKHYMEKIKINDKFITVAGETRENLKIVDPENNTFTDINDIGPSINNNNIDLLKKTIHELTVENELIVFSGSIPIGCPEEIYKELIEIAHKNDAYVILDTYGKPFKLALDGKPDLIKPNIEELEAYFNQKLEKIDEIVNIVQNKIIPKGIPSVVVSLGVEGALLINKDYYYKTTGLKVKVESTVGAGDAMVAGIAFSIKNNFDSKLQLLYGSAAATGNIMTPGTQTGDIETIKALLEKISIKKEMTSNENN